jgi:hypothetical protein
MAAVGEEASPPPYHALSYAPLALLAKAYRAAGAEVFTSLAPHRQPRGKSEREAGNP